MGKHVHILLVGAEERQLLLTSKSTICARSKDYGLDTLTKLMAITLMRMMMHV